MNYRTTFLISLTLLTLFVLGCKNNITDYQTQIINPEYISYQIQDERGYRVSFQVSNEIEVPVAVVINKVKMPIVENQKEGLKYNVNVIASSRLIQNYHPEISDKENGIFFKKKNSRVFFRPIPFEIK